jgi:predicted membrane-bound spermidine synthase
MTRLYLLFFCSGAAGLVYQVVWVREFGNVFGNTVHSASLVFAVFMCGLGVGGYLAGRWADRHYRDAPGLLLRTYAYVEGAIAVLGLGIAIVLPRLGEVSATISAYTTDASGWHVLTTASLLTRYAIAVALLGPITLLMGGTLTVLIRHLVRLDLDAAGWKIGALYGVNTAGAALGCVLTDWALIPFGGLWMTQLVAVGLNLCAAVGALRLAAGGRAPIEAPAVSAEPRVVSAAVVTTVIAVAASGFAAMGMEIVWFRHLSALLGSYRWVLSLILTVILVGIWLGALAGGYVHRRLGQPVVLFALAQALFIVGTLGGLIAAESRAVVGEGTSLGRTLVLVARELALPALMMGFTFPLANAIVQDAERAVGRRAGLLYLANTFGAVAGALVTGFVLLPSLGMQRTVTLLALAVVLGLAPLCVATVARASREALVVGTALAALGVAALSWASLPADYLVGRTLWPLRPREQRLTVREGVAEVVSVTEMPGEGRALQTNGHLMSGTAVESQRYMRAFVHIPLLSQDMPERVLVICFGVGNTAHAATLHPSVRRVDVVDLSRNVLAHADYFAATNGRVLRHPSVAVHVNDGRQHLKMRPPAVYDLITLEPPPIAFAGVASLYSREFYALARSRLRPGGYVTQWLPVSQASPDAVLSMVRAFIEVFPQTVLLSGWTDNLILMGTNGDRLHIDPARVELRLAGAPPLRDDLARVHLGTLTEIVGTFVATAETLRPATEVYPPVTDDYPIQEYWATSKRPDPALLSTLFDPSRVAAWCPACLVDGRPRGGLEALPRRLELLAAFYRGPQFHTYGTSRAEPRTFRVPIDAAVVGAVIADSPYLRRVFSASAP